MHILVKATDHNPTLPLRVEIAHEIWTPTVNGRRISYSHDGSTESLRDEGYLGISYDKVIDPLWSSHVQGIIRGGNAWIWCRLIRNAKVYCVYTDWIDAFTLDQRALYLFTIMLAENLNSEISEDGGKTWSSPQQFKVKHKALLSLSYKSALLRSVLELPKFSAEVTIENFETMLDPVGDYIDDHLMDGGSENDFDLGMIFRD